ncbi:alpha/beta fold hydrolase [Dactylosporangium siamense]|uniref:2-hydroxy-6-ketonona-2,4-dienedioic acid hydrolase n=1 Tax=Dactylosporangium siamense TaxID=685454 RepID=A0A919PI13_9ACTN|nr:alpha/beta fold hydrolase [Dactylosporangium siamense]GIG42593.1 2-hydroxy-6-ketonona-2,4-dienedioic acid hydrolase [Dactylosporangium siamense]
MTIWTTLAGTEFSLTSVDADGIMTRSLQCGPADGEPVVFLHGTSGHLEAFVRNLRAHADAGYRCHAIDMVGHGYTDKPGYRYEIPTYRDHLVAYLDAIGAPRAHLVGESLGGWVAARLAADAPQRVGSLQLLCPGGTKADPAVMARIRNSTTEAVLTDDIALTRKRLELLMFDPAADVSDELVEVRHAIYHQPDFVKGLPHLLCLQEPQIRERNLLTPEQLGRVQAPTLVVWSTQNPFGAVPEGAALAAAIPGARLKIFKECGHWPQHERAEAYNALSLAFLQEFAIA